MSIKHLNGSIVLFGQQFDICLEIEKWGSAIDQSNAIRADRLKPWEGWEDLLDCAPDRDGEFYRVPKIGSSEG
ncbi:MAG: hypothetical protein HC860_04480 [Alkalinema sp. RU_4_3]|nr:hypothetical protein [Alkalinema sp. RU_4_3]